MMPRNREKSFECMRGPAPAGRSLSPFVRALGVLFQLDRLFVGVEHGALGYLALATRP